MSIRGPILLPAVAICLAIASAAEDRILRPADKSAVKPGPLSIVAAGTGTLLLDGKPVVERPPAPGVHSAVVTLSPGAHEIALGAARAAVFAGPGAPAGFKEFRQHPPAAACDTCHTVAAGAWEIKDGACFQCHKREDFVRPHQHNAEVLAECQLCHNPHGSTEKAHMKMRKELACKQCHG